MKYRLRDLQNFVATAPCATMVSAAKKLEISQPALSESIARLEKDMGNKLFYRSRVGIRLTPSGRLLFQRAKQLLLSFSELNTLPNSGAVFGDQVISIGAHPTVAQYFIPDTLAKLKALAPDYRIELKHGLSRDIQAEVQRGSIDIAIVVNATIVPDLVIKTLATDQVCVWHSQAQYTADMLISNPNLFQTQSILKRWKTKKPSRHLPIDDLELIYRLTEKGLGFGIIPTRLVEMLGRRLVRHASAPKFEDRISIIYRPEFGKSNSERAVIEALSHSIN